MVISEVGGSSIQVVPPICRCSRFSRTHCHVSLIPYPRPPPMLCAPTQAGAPACLPDLSFLHSGVVAPSPIGCLVRLGSPLQWPLLDWACLTAPGPGQWTGGGSMLTQHLACSVSKVKKPPNTDDPKQAELIQVFTQPHCHPPPTPPPPPPMSLTLPVPLASSLCLTCNVLKIRNLRTLTAPSRSALAEDASRAGRPAGPRGKPQGR